MAPTQELQNKHTLFGKVVGDTIYNMIKLQDVEIGANDRPLHPPKILRTKVLINPFPDIEPRKVIQMEDVKADSKKPKSQMKATKDYKLLSFGDEAEDDEEDLDQVQVKVKSSHDVLNDPKLSKITGEIPKAKIHILSENSHIENPSFYKIHLSEISFFTKFTFLKYQIQGNFWVKIGFLP